METTEHRGAIHAVRWPHSLDRKARWLDGRDRGERDTGVGIPREHLPFLFERFRQVDSSITRTYGGLGLGLSIVRHLVEAHGGTVGARSEGPGLGATFTVKLPFGAVLAPQPPWAHPVADANAAEGAGSGPFVDPPHALLRDVRVLVVEDDCDSADLLRIVLEEAGARVTTATSAQDALAATACSASHAIVSDIEMPELIGYAFMEARSGATERAVPALALTSCASEAAAAWARRTGYQRHIAKPADRFDLVESVRELVSEGARDPWPATAPR